MTGSEFQSRYIALLHAVQTGVALDMERSKETGQQHLKHLRTGLNGTMYDTASLGKLLIAKGIITIEEYHEAIIEGLEAEVERYERYIFDTYSLAVRLR